MISSPSFARLVAALKRHQKTCTVIESSCGGLINASILAQPGASAVYWGGSIAYNTRKAKPLLLNDDALHASLLVKASPETDSSNPKDEINDYLQSKRQWTHQTSVAFCRALDTDFCIAEGGATGPTFRPAGMTTGFCTVAIAGKTQTQSSDGNDVDMIQMMDQQVIQSRHANREENMRLFADAAAELALKVIEQTCGNSNDYDDKHDNNNNNNNNDNMCHHQHGKPHFDRATHVRSDPEKLQQLAKDASYVVLHKSCALFRKPHNNNPTTTTQAELSHNRELRLLNAQQVEAVYNTVQAKKETTFLGLLNERDPVFGVDLLLSQQNNNIDTRTMIQNAIQSTLENSNDNSDVVLEDTRSVAPLLQESCHNELVLHATAMAQWQRRSPFCSACGAPTRLEQGGTSRICTGCGQASWPRQDPSMIAVVSNRAGTKVLLGRSKRHPAKMHTALAGFVEAGETMERAVAREVFEETGIRVDEESVQYIASQPWPFPQSTMIGFTVQADDSQPLNIDTNELVEAAWFDKSQVRLASTVLGPVMQPPVAEAALASNPNLELLIPPKGVLARTLIDKWLGQ